MLVNKKKKKVTDGYREYRKLVNKPLTLKEYTKVIYDFMSFCKETLLDKGEIKLPYKFGVLKIVGKKLKPTVKDGKIKGLSPDYKQTKEFWKQNPEAAKDKKMIFHTNEHSNFIRYRVSWVKKNLPIYNKGCFYFVFARANKRALAKKIKEGKEYTII